MEMNSDGSREYFDINLRREVPKDAIDRAIVKLDKFIDQYEWDEARMESISIQKKYAGSARVADLRSRVSVAFDRYKDTVQKKFLEAGSTDDMDAAMKWLKELDKVLTPEEAAPFAKLAKRVIEGKKQRLAMQLRMSIHMEDWAKGTEICEEIVGEFPNTKMADEARSMVEKLRDRARNAAFSKEPEPSWS